MSSKNDANIPRRMEHIIVLRNGITCSTRVLDYEYSTPYVPLITIHIDEWWMMIDEQPQFWGHCYSVIATMFNWYFRIWLLYLCNIG